MLERICQPPIMVDYSIACGQSFFNKRCLQMKYDVIIIGGGLGGIFSAYELVKL